MSAARPEVLVVDDDALIREALQAHLKLAEYEPVLAEDGLQGLALLERDPERYATVLLDRTMPGMDGMEVLARIKGQEALTRIPVIMETALAREKDVQEGLEAGAYYYLTKPFSKKTLLAIVKSAVADRMAYLHLRHEARKATGSFSLMVKGSYAFRTLEEGEALATLLARCSANPERIVMGLSELMVNAVEHGNLGITYEEKSRLMASDSWKLEVERRLGLQENRDKSVQVDVERASNEIRYRIRDQGDGFDWRGYLEISPERAFHSHGRGIAMSRKLCFDQIEFLGVGNEVIATIRETGNS